MASDRSGLEPYFSRLSAILSSWPELSDPPQPEAVDESQLIEQLNFLAETGAPHAPALLEYFSLVAKYGVHAVSDLYGYTDPCDLAQALEARQFKCEIIERIDGLITDDYDESLRKQTVIWPLSFVPISESEGRGYAIRCGAVAPGSVWSFDKSGNLHPEFDSVNSFLEALLASFEGTALFSDGMPWLDQEGIIEWT